MGTGKQRISTAARLEARAEGGPVLELELVQVQAELALAQVAVRELALAQVAVPELELVQVQAELELVRVAAVPGLVQVAAELELVRAAVALRTKSVTEAHRPGLVLRLAAGASAVAVETTRVPAAAGEVIAWEVADSVAVEEAAVVAEAAVGDEKRSMRKHK